MPRECDIGIRYPDGTQVGYAVIYEGEDENYIYTYPGDVKWTKPNYKVLHLGRDLLPWEVEQMCRQMHGRPGFNYTPAPASPAVTHQQPEGSTDALPQ